MLKESKIMDVFNKYVKKFDMNKGNVKAVYFHSLKMMDLCKNIASNLGIFSDEEIIICGFIGLFCDVGMFGNKNRLCHFNSSIDYSKKSVEIIFDKDKLIRDITDDTRYDDIIKVAIYCHNKNGLPNGLNNKILHFCKVVRDAHTIENFRLIVNYQYIDMHIDNFPSDIVYNTFKQYNVISNKIGNNDADNVLEVLSYIFGVNYHYCFVLLKEEESVNKLITSLKISNKALLKFFNQIGAVLNMYIDRKIVG